MSWVSVIDLFWPVGSVYFTVDNSGNNNPSDLFGGQWVSLGTITIGNNTVYSWRRSG